MDSLMLGDYQSMMDSLTLEHTVCEGLTELIINDNGLTAEVGVRVVLYLLFLLPEVVQAEVGDLHYEAAVHHAVRGLQVAMGTDLRAVNVGHALEESKRSTSDHLA